MARSARAIKIGTLRPAIVLYDEPHPLGDDIGALQGADAARRPDMLVVMGTSLKVHGLKALVRDFAKAVRAAPTSAAEAKKGAPKGRIVFVNRTPPPAEWAGVFDYWVKGETDEWVTHVEQDWRRMRPADWEVQQTLDAGAAPLKARKTGGPAAKPKGMYMLHPIARHNFLRPPISQQAPRATRTHSPARRRIRGREHRPLVVPVLPGFVPLLAKGATPTLPIHLPPSLSHQRALGHLATQHAEQAAQRVLALLALLLALTAA